MNAHFHFHVCVIDGVFGEDPEGSVQFHEAAHLTSSDWGDLQHIVRHRVLRYFRRQGLLARHVTDDMLTWSTRWAAVSAIRRALHDGHTRRDGYVVERATPPLPWGSAIVWSSRHADAQPPERERDPPSDPGRFLCCQGRGLGDHNLPATCFASSSCSS